ncbi:MAG: hypothetical protein HY304_00455 [candidate division Zixibacteria bacterium]|nr:hypothetical protein [candidate division Zixibacteria bacterium]
MNGLDKLELTQDVIATLSDEQMSVLQELGELAAKKLKVSQAISEFTERVLASQRTMGFQTKDDPTGLHEDPEVIALVTIKDRFKLSNIREQIQRTLRRAVELDLGSLALIQRQCKVYGVDCNKQAGPERRYFSDQGATG